MQRRTAIRQIPVIRAAMRFSSPRAARLSFRQPRVFRDAHGAVHVCDQQQDDKRRTDLMLRDGLLAAAETPRS